MANETVCQHSSVGQVTDGLALYSLVFSIVSFSILAFSLLAWIVNRNLPYLRKRSSTQIALLTTSWVCNLLAGPVSRASLKSPSILNSCVLINLTFSMVIPAFLGPQVIRLILFRNRVKYNRKLSETFTNTSDSRGQFELLTVRSPGEPIRDETKSQIDRLRYKASPRFGVVLAAAGFVFSVLLCVAFTLFSCPQLGVAKDCFVASMDTLLTVLLFMFPAIIFFILLLKFSREVRKYPDPFGILHEIKTVFMFGLPLCILSIVLMMINPGDFNIEGEPYRFDYTLLFDVAFLLVFCYSIPYQIYRARKSRKQDFDHSVSFKAVLDNPIGRQLFRQHLINEFSVENLNFYEAVEIFKETFNRDEKRYLSRGKFAKNLFSRYLARRHVTQVNVSDAIIRNLASKMEGDNFEVKVDLFNEAAEEVYSLMENDSFRRFQNTAEYKEYIGANVSTSSPHSQSTI